jgi:malonate transporter and related proteins
VTRAEADVARIHYFVSARGLGYVMNVLMVVAGTFALVVVGYVAAIIGIISDDAQKGISDFALSIAIPVVLFRTIVISKFSASGALLVWAAYFGSVLLTWLVALALSARLLKQEPTAAVIVATTAAYGNTAILGIPLVLNAFGQEAAGPMALIVAFNTPLLWIVGTLQIAWLEQKDRSSTSALVALLLRNPIILAMAAGFLWRFTDLGLDPLIDHASNQLAQAGSPTALVALGLGLVRFRMRGEALLLAFMCALKLVAMPLFAWALSFPLLHLPPQAGNVIVLLAAMPAAANAHLFAVECKQLANATSAAVALGTLLAALTLPLIIALLPAIGHP